MKTFYFLTNQCNASCPYCFVEHGTDIMTSKDIDDSISKLPEDKYSEIVIYGGEPTLFPDTLLRLVESLLKDERKNLTIYSNGYNTSILDDLDKLRVQVYINLDAYQGDLHKIQNFDWVYTIAPSNLDKILDIYDLYNQNRKFPDFKIMHYYRPGADYWTEESVNRLENVLKDLYAKYKEILLETGSNMMPGFIRNYLMRLINRTTGSKNKHECSSYITFMPNGVIRNCYSCLDISRKINCSNCNISEVCSMNTPCYSDIPEQYQKLLCRIEKMIFETTIKLNSELKNETIWQQVILNVCKQGFSDGHM